MIWKWWNEKIYSYFLFKPWISSCVLVNIDWNLIKCPNETRWQKAVSRPFVTYLESNVGGSVSWNSMYEIQHPWNWSGSTFLYFHFVLSDILTSKVARSRETKIGKRITNFSREEEYQRIVFRIPTKLLT